MRVDGVSRDPRSGHIARLRTHPLSMCHGAVPAGTADESCPRPSGVCSCRRGRLPCSARRRGVHDRVGDEPTVRASTCRRCGTGHASRDQRPARRSPGRCTRTARSAPSRSPPRACLTATSTSRSATYRSPTCGCTTRATTGGRSLHNHFILKSLALTRPGGLVVVLSSHYTLDAGNPAARREMSALADLIGAVRLPTGAHYRCGHRRADGPADPPPALERSASPGHRLGDHPAGRRRRPPRTTERLSR